MKERMEKEKQEKGKRRWAEDGRGEGMWFGEG